MFTYIDTVTKETYYISLNNESSKPIFLSSTDVYIPDLSDKKGIKTVLAFQF
jgi:hypothetical protein